MIDEEEAIRAYVEKVKKAVEKFGLYMTWANGRREDVEGQLVMVGADQAPHPNSRLTVRMIFDIGSQAFSEKVQNPEMYSDMAIIAQIEHATYEDAAARILEKFLTTGKVLDEGDDEF